MARKRITNAEGASMDSLMDTLTNVVGILVIVLILGLFAVFAKQADTRRLVLGLGLVFVFFILLARDRITAAWLKRQTETDATKERIVVAGSGGEKVFSWTASLARSRCSARPAC